MIFARLLKRTMSSPSTMERGALIVLEGCDKSGKSTQCNLLVEKLKKNGVSAQLLKFPDRTTAIGHMIDSYLKQTCQVEDHAIHLLFTANRWEAMPNMLQQLKSGITLVVDRYSFSGVAFSAAKPGMNLDWCRQPEQGLLRPDCVFYLTLKSEIASERGDFGIERYERKDFQEKVASMFDKLHDDTWKIIAADKTVDELSEELFNKTISVINQARMSKLEYLWMDE